MCWASFAVRRDWQFDIPVYPHVYLLHVGVHGQPWKALAMAPTQFIGLPNIKLATTFPRDLHRLEP